MTYLDTDAYYQRRREQQEFAMLLRNYYEGHPYTAKVEDRLTQIDVPRQLWVDIMEPDPADEEITYLENSVRNKIDDIVTDVFPNGTKIIWENLPESEDDALEKAIAEKLYNFADDYPSGEAGLREWINSVLTDIATTGDGLALLQGEGEGETAQVRFAFHPSEAWDMEQTERHLPLFYRIE